MENELSPQAELNALDERRKELKVSISSGKKELLAKAKEKRAIRDDQIKKDMIRISSIQKEIYKYNKLGKIGKEESNIFEDIVTISLGANFTTRSFECPGETEDSEPLTN